MTRSQTIAVLIALVVAHIVLAGLFASQTPYRTAGLVLSGGGYVHDIGAPDERQHANYIGRIMRGEGLAVLDPSDPNQYENYQAHQPPLYYVLAAGWAKALQSAGLAKATTDDLPVETTPAGAASRTFERRPLQIPDGVPTRMLNALIGGLTIAGVFALAWWGYRKKEIAVAAASFAALLPMNLALSGAISNDPLLICLCTWTLAVTALSLREGWTIGRAASAGLLAGLAILTKSTAIALLPTLLVAVCLKQKARPTLTMIATAVLCVGVLAVPWWLRNQAHYGDPLAMKAFLKAFAASPHREDFVTKTIPALQPGANPELAYWIDWVGYWTARSFVGAFGYMDIWLTADPYARPVGALSGNTLYWAVFAMMGACTVGWFLSWKSGEAKTATPVRIVGLAFIAFVLASFIQFETQYFQAQARYVLPALGPIAVGLATGACTLASKRPKVAAIAIAIVLLGLDAASLARLGPQFQIRIDAGKQYVQQHPGA